MASRLRWPLRRVLIAGPSMAPALRHGDQALVWIGPHRLRVGAVVVVALPDRPLAVKRLVRYDEAGVWVEGDNAFGSTDSRTLGILPRQAVRGVVLGRVWPRPGHVGRSH